ncbi:MAG: isoprenylcysteine carboxylmethyltransferase family protein [Candidatus Aminicenantes bacterium]|nr:isoprenylcysteine carboxylmethyltransferase family protein [Acidobacteriota bacterium]MCG2812981.1 isoprenylcysteine carboxylmethyltransferase family protein [Candidatus Aminicenantes bacterium]
MEGKSPLPALRAILLLAVLLAAFFLPAGSLDWPEAWLVLGSYLLVCLAAFVLFAFPVVQLFRVIHHNRFLSERVRIQTDRGHRVCSTGPYARVRHPMYAAIILFVLLLPPALGSFFGLIPALLVAALFVLRTHLEDRTLLKELNGYSEYARQVPYRLIRGLW